ncbi:MAG TPA: PIG-L family deacetylase, partial [Oligoflexia bacterium]|nr:PIG-L family deacetylase [Oligoflexia bacterium]
MRKTLKLIALYCTGIALANLALLFFRAVLAPPLPLYHFNKPVKLLVLAAHQDDEVIQAGGLLLKNIALGGSSTIAFLTSPAIPSDAAIRENEARRIWEVFGEKKPLLHFMRFPSQSWWPDNAKAEARASLRAVIENAQPELIVIPLEERGSYEHDLLNNLSWSLAPDFPDVRWLQAAEYNPFYLAEESPAKLLWFMIRLLPFVPYREPNYGLYPEQQLVLAMSSAELTNKKKLLLGYVSQRDIIPLSQFAYPDLFEETRHIPQNVSKIFGKYVSNYALISILLVFAALFLTGIWIGLSARAGACLIVISALIPACVFASARPILIKEQLLLVAAVAAGFILMCCLRGFRFYASRRGRGINGNRSIAIVCHLYPPSYGGTQRFMQWLAEELKSDGMTVTV